MKKVLITGAGGFIGSHLTELCVEQGLSVRAFVHYNSKNNCGWLGQSPCLKDIEIISGDIRDYDSVYSAARNCDTIFHLAALIGIPYSYVSPLAYIKTNIEGTYNVLQAARELNTQKVLVTSTSETYGTAQYVPMDEKHPMVGQSPYSASKIGADNLAISYFRSFDLPVTIVRPFNTFGPRQSARAIIPSVITQLLSCQSLCLGSLTPTRDLTFVKDTAMGFLAIAKSKKVAGEIINIGMGEEHSIADLISIIAKILGQSKPKIKQDACRIRPKKSEVNRLFCDNAKIKKLTGWVPKYTLKTGLVETIEWFKSNLNCYNPKIYNV